MDNLKSLIGKFKGLHILVIGDIILDEHVIGSVERINPEAPVPVLHAKKSGFSLGGAANVAKNITSMGGKCTLIGQVGKDENRNILIQELRKNKINHFLIERNDFHTIKKTRFVAKGQQLIRVDWEDPQPLKEKDADSILKFIKNKKFDIIIISDYNKGVVTPYFMKKLKKSSVRIIADPKPENVALFKGVFLVTPNKKEAYRITGIKDIEEAGKALVKELGSNVSITRGPDGVSLFDKSNKHHYLPTEAKEVFDVSGAGDTFTAAISLGLASGVNIYESLILANIAAGIVVEKFGTADVSGDEILGRFTKQESKVKNWKEIKSVAKGLKAKGKTVVFTNGCFDILHRGHIKLLKEAKSYGDILILGLNTDSSIKKLKGKKRPINNEEDRAEVISSVECVDYIVFFDQDTPLEIIKEIIPDILVKGNDYKESNIVGGDFVKKNGGKVRLVQLVEGKSTTNIIDKVKK